MKRVGGLLLLAAAIIILGGEVYVGLTSGIPGPNGVGIGYFVIGLVLMLAGMHLLCD